MIHDVTFMPFEQNLVASNKCPGWPRDCSGMACIVCLTYFTLAQFNWEVRDVAHCRREWMKHFSILWSNPRL